jgi:tetratricopeptide (TPR) repeat protein
VEESTSDNLQTAEKHYQQGYRWFEAGEWKLALEELKLCLKHDPLRRKYSRFYSRIAAELIAHHYRQAAEELQREGRFAEAIDGLRRVLRLKINPREFRRLIRQTKQLQRWLTAVYEQACELLAQEKLTKAKRKALELLEQAPQWTEAQTLLARIEQREQAQELYAQGAKLYRANHYEEARRLLEQSLVLDRNYSAPRVLLERMSQELITTDYEPEPEPAPSLPLEESVLLLEEAAEVPIADGRPAEKHGSGGKG